MLELRSVSYRYAGYRRETLHGVDLAAAPGEIVVVLGASDSGLSTLCLVASGLAPAAVGGELTGHVSLDGTRLRDLPAHALGELVGLVPDDAAAARSGVAASVFEEVAFGPVNLGLPLAETISRVRSALADTGTAHLAERSPDRLSGGEQRLVSIASILALRPRYLVLDEPAAGLDRSGVRTIQELLGSLAAEGAGILVTSHDAELVAAVATRVAVLEAGRVAMAGTADAVLADPRLEGLGVAPPEAIWLEREILAAGLVPPEPIAT